MQAQPFYWETRSVLTQFINAFDGIIIKRYDKNRIPQSRLAVRYVYSPKQRVIFDLVNKAQNITLPVVAVSITGISRDTTRVFNKLNGFTLPRAADPSRKDNLATISYKTPVPVNIAVNVSFITRYQSDMDQIISNFVPYNNPYIIISWKMPDAIAASGSNTGFPIAQEIRSEVEWSGNIALQYPTDINANTQYHIIGDTSFTIKSWLFQDQQNDLGNIYYIDANFHNIRDITTFSDLSSIYTGGPILSAGIYSTTETVSISGFPQVTNLDFIDFTI